MEMNANAHELMKLARRLAQDGHGEHAQILRDCIDDARRFRWLLANDRVTSTIYLATDSPTQSMHPENVRARIDTDANQLHARRIAAMTRSA
jgi:hypothetical protein